MQKDIRKVKLVQRRITRYVTNQHHNTSSASDMSNHLKWTSSHSIKTMITSHNSVQGPPKVSHSAAWPSHKYPHICTGKHTDFLPMLLTMAASASGKCFQYCHRSPCAGFLPSQPGQGVPYSFFRNRPVKCCTCIILEPTSICTKLSIPLSTVSYHACHSLQLF